MSAARYGRRWSIGELPPPAGARPISRSAFFAWFRWRCWCSCCARRSAVRRCATTPTRRRPRSISISRPMRSRCCCVAMAMPQVHIVAYCGDLGYGVARGAEMLSLMMGFGIISRIGSGFLADRIGGIRTLLIGSVAQGFALLFYLFFDSLTSLYLISGMFGLFQGGIVPSYAIIVREAMPAAQAATRVGIVIFASVFGMSFGGWASGVIFDATGSYAAAFANGLAWNVLNIAIIVALLMRARQRLVPA